MKLSSYKINFVFILVFRLSIDIYINCNNINQIISDSGTINLHMLANVSV